MVQSPLIKATIITQKQARDFLTFELTRDSGIKKLTRAGLGHDKAAAEHDGRLASRLKQFAISVAQKSNMPLTEAHITDAVGNIEIHTHYWHSPPSVEVGTSRQSYSTLHPDEKLPHQEKQRLISEDENKIRAEVPGRVIKLPKKVGPSKTAKTGYALGIGIVGAMGAASDFIAGSLLMQSFTYPSLPEIGLSVSVLLTSTYGTIGLIKNMAGAWKNRLASDSQNIANALETAIRDVLAKAVPAKPE